MKELRRRLPKAISPLEMLDDRIVPSALGFNPVKHAAVAEHSPIRVRLHHRLAHRAQIQAAPLAASPSPAAADSGPVASTPAPAPSATRAVLVPDPATSAVTVSPTTSNDVPPVTVSLEEIKNGPLAKAGQALVTLFAEYQQQQGSTTFTSSEAGLLLIQGTNVGVDIHVNGAGIDAFANQLTSLGMQVTTKDPDHGIIDGFLPISQLLTVAQDPQTASLSPIMHSFTR